MSQRKWWFWMNDFEANNKAPIKRSVRIAGHRTSFSLEEEFWNELKEIALRQGQSINVLVSAIDAARKGNLSSALRTYVLLDLKMRSR
jgi:predicted DNA-binding ribbon-helix-helix protein